MLLLLFFFPVAIYLLILGGINRRQRPLMVSGIWDFIGVLFAGSGFLLFGGPAILSILSTFSDRWRLFWLIGRPPVSSGSDGAFWQTWLFLAIVYFGLVVAGSAYFLWRSQRLTSIYNIDRDQVEKCLARVFEQLGLQPVHSGGLYLFGVPSENPPPGGLQAPHYLPTGITTRPASHSHAPAEQDFLGQTAVLEIDHFFRLRHATLRWDPGETLYRKQIEDRLDQLLHQIPAAESEVGGWLLVLGVGLLALELLGGILLLFLHYLGR